MEVRSAHKIRKRRSESYRDKSEYVADLKRVFKEDYSCALSDEELQEIARNLDAFLGAFN